MTSSLLSSRAGHGAVEEFDDMEDFLMGMVDFDADAELQQAARVGGDDGLGTSGLDVAHFLGEQFEGCFCLCDVVDSGGAAADFRVGQFHKLEIGDGA